MAIGSKWVGKAIPNCVMSTPGANYVSGTFILSSCTMGQILSAMTNSQVVTAKVPRAQTVIELQKQGFTHLAMEWHGPGRSKVSRLIMWPKKVPAK